MGKLWGPPRSLKLHHFLVLAESPSDTPLKQAHDDYAGGTGTLMPRVPSLTGLPGMMSVVGSPLVNIVRPGPLGPS